MSMVPRRGVLGVLLLRHQELTQESVVISALHPTRRVLKRFGVMSDESHPRITERRTRWTDLSGPPPAVERFSAARASCFEALLPRDPTKNRWKLRSRRRLRPRVLSSLRRAAPRLDLGGVGFGERQLDLLETVSRVSCRGRGDWVGMRYPSGGLNRGRLCLSLGLLSNKRSCGGRRSYRWQCLSSKDLPNKGNTSRVVAEATIPSEKVSGDAYSQAGTSSKICMYSNYLEPREKNVSFCSRVSPLIFCFRFPMYFARSSLLFPTVSICSGTLWCCCRCRCYC